MDDTFPKAAFAEPAPTLLTNPKREETIEEHWPHVQAKGHLARLSPVDLAQFVSDVCEGLLYLSVQAPPNLVRSIFLPLALGAFSDWPPEKLQDIGIFYERLDKAGPLGINGQPMFLSMWVLHKDDWAKAKRAIVNEIERRKEAQKALEKDLEGWAWKTGRDELSGQPEVLDRSYAMRSNTALADALSHLIMPTIVVGILLPPWNVGWWAYALCAGILKDSTGMGVPYLIGLPGVVLTTPLVKAVNAVRAWEEQGTM
jgi:hypothetical protein